MTTETLEGWVLHKRPSGDTSVRITFFTREKGVLTCLCKGGRTPKKQALLQPFSSLWLAIDTRKDWYYARNIESTTNGFKLNGEALFAGLYLNELLYYALAPMDAHPELFDVYLLTLRGLTTTTDRLVIEALLRRFEYALLLACGCSISFTEEACSTNAIVSHKQYQFIASTGFMASNEGGVSGGDILALSQGRLSDLNVLKTAKIIMRQAIDHLLGGRELKSRSLYIRQKN
ncbi:TPA: DNA repair protein RecO [Legionella feeleii]